MKEVLRCFLSELLWFHVVFQHVLHDERSLVPSGSVTRHLSLSQSKPIRGGRLTGLGCICFCPSAARRSVSSPASRLRRCDITGVYLQVHGLRLNATNQKLLPSASLPEEHLASHQQLVSRLNMEPNFSLGPIS